MSTPANTPFTVVVTIQDPDGDTCANGEADVSCTVSLDTIPSGSEGAVLSGTLTKTAVAGVITFDDLEIDTAGVGYTLAIECDTPIDIYPVGTGSLAPAVSDAFNVGAESIEVDRGVIGTGNGFSSLLAVGSVNPTSVFGSDIYEFSIVPSESNWINTFSVNALVDQDFFSVITTSIAGVPQYFQSSQALWTQESGKTTWTWTQLIPFWSESLGPVTVTISQ